MIIGRSRGQELPVFGAKVASLWHLSGAADFETLRLGSLRFDFGLSTDRFWALGGSLWHHLEVSGPPKSDVKNKPFLYVTYWSQLQARRSGFSGSWGRLSGQSRGTLISDVLGPRP